MSKTITGMVVGAVVLFGGTLALLVFGLPGQPASAQPDLQESLPSPEEFGTDPVGFVEPEVPITPRDHFTLYPADRGAWQYADQSEEMQATIDAAGEWAETKSGYVVHQAWSRARVWSVRHTELVSAERAAGLSGSENLGVE